MKRLGSLVIPAFNEEKYLEQLLESLVSQETSAELEIIVVDNASTDSTAVIARRYERQYPVRVLLENRRGRGSARAAGFAAAQGEIILSTDADSIAPSDWVEKMVAPFASSAVVATTSLLRTYDLSPARNTLYFWLDVLYMYFHRVVFGNHTVVGCSFAIRRETYQQANGFRPELLAQEDVDLGWRLRKLGRVELVKDVVMGVSGRRFRKGFVAGFYEYGKTLWEIFVLKRTTDLKDVR